jgi:diguanylate cyclase (GGDEF)-like protein
MDLGMTKVNGESLVRKILNAERHVSLPIIFLSSHRIDSYDTGMDTEDEVLSKPIEAQRLLSTVTRRLAKIRELPEGGNKEQQLMPLIAVERQHFISELNRALGATPSEHALLVIGLGNLSPLRETLGIDETEQVVEESLQLVQHHLHNADRLTRFTDNTLTVLTKYDDEEQLHCFTRELYTLVNEHVAKTGTNFIKLDCSIGIALFGDDAHNAHQLLSDADGALEVAAGKSEQRIHYYNSARDKHIDIKRRQRIRNLINNTLRDDAFNFLYQPIVSLTGASGEKFDVTITMRDECGQQINVNQLCSSSSRCEQKSAVDRWVIEHAISNLHDQRCLNKKTIFFIPTSLDTLLDKQFISWLASKLREKRLSGKRLVFTVSESEVASHLRETRQLINELGQFSARVCIELHNTGEQLNYLLDYIRIHFIKLGAAFTHNLVSNPVTQEQLQGLLRNLLKKGKRAIASGIDNTAMFPVLRDCNVAFLQSDAVQAFSPMLEFDFTQSIVPPPAD